MKAMILILLGHLVTTMPICAAEAAGPSSTVPAAAQERVLPKEEAKTLAEKRYTEMLDRMQGAVEEVAQLYGNPGFLQVFTNDAERADELKHRLRIAGAIETARRELENLEKQRNELMADIALKTREASRLSAKLIRQRAALDSFEAALQTVRVATEDTTKTKP